MEENKKSGGGDVRAKASSWNGEWDKAKNDCKGTVLLQSNSAYSIHYQYFITIFPHPKNFKEKSFQNQPLTP
ncbi:MAG: hypothetical protein ACI307_07380 [Sodaliphilus sp.]